MSSAFLYSLNHLLADWHSHHGGGGPSSPPTPEAEALGIAFVCVIIGGLALSALNLLGGSLLLFFTPRKRTAFRLVPLANLLLYMIPVLLRKHPLGLPGQFWGVPLIALILELLIILVLSLFWVSLLTLIRWIFERLFRKQPAPVA